MNTQIDMFPNLWDYKEEKRRYKKFERAIKLAIGDIQWRMQREFAFNAHIAENFPNSPPPVCERHLKEYRLREDTIDLLLDYLDDDGGAP